MGRPFGFGREGGKIPLAGRVAVQQVVRQLVSERFRPPVGRKGTPQEDASRRGVRMLTPWLRGSVFTAACDGPASRFPNPILEKNPIAGSWRCDRQAALLQHPRPVHERPARVAKHEPE